MVLIPAPETLGNPGRPGQNICFDAATTNDASAVSTLIQTNESIGDVFEMPELVAGDFEELDVYLPVEATLQGHR